jgi:hypothetical protein
MRGSGTFPPGSDVRGRTADLPDRPRWERLVRVTRQLTTTTGACHQPSTVLFSRGWVRPTRTGRTRKLTHVRSIPRRSTNTIEDGDMELRNGVRYGRWQQQWQSVRAEARARLFSFTWLPPSSSYRNPSFPSFPFGKPAPSSLGIASGTSLGRSSGPPSGRWSGRPSGRGWEAASAGS